jgi:uncharacterized membrane protein
MGTTLPFSPDALPCHLSSSVHHTWDSNRGQGRDSNRNYLTTRAPPPARFMSDSYDHHTVDALLAGGVVIEMTAQSKVFRTVHKSEQRLREIETRLTYLLPALAQKQRVARDINAEFEASFSLLDRVALVITERVGSFGFFLVIFTWSVLWLGWNLLAPKSLRFDPAPAFVLWLFISNLIQIMLMPLLMVGQNLQGRHAELRAEHDFEINQKAEQEVEALLLQMEQQVLLLRRQEQMLRDLLATAVCRFGTAPQASPNCEMPK